MILIQLDFVRVVILLRSLLSLYCRRVLMTYEERVFDYFGSRQITTFLVPARKAFLKGVLHADRYDDATTPHPPSNKERALG